MPWAPGAADCFETPPWTWWTWPPVWYVRSPWLMRGWRQKVPDWPGCWSGRAKVWGVSLSCHRSECKKPWWGTWRPGQTGRCRAGSCGSSPGWTSASAAPVSPPERQTGSWACHPPAGAGASCGSRPLWSPAGCICSPSASWCQQLRRREALWSGSWPDRRFQDGGLAHSWYPWWVVKNSPHHPLTCA